MASIGLVAKCLPSARRFLSNPKHLPASYSLIRSMAYWNKDWKPGPYPKTEAERRAAAKKYNMIYEDYEPYPDDGSGYGDYPKLPHACSEGRDANINWDIPHVRRNYGEPMHVDSDILTEDRWSPDLKRRYSYGYMVSRFLLVCTIFIAVEHFGPIDGYEMDLKPKQLWAPGVTHYSFETKSQDEAHHH